MSTKNPPSCSTPSPSSQQRSTFQQVASDWHWRSNTTMRQQDASTLSIALLSLALLSCCCAKSLRRQGTHVTQGIYTNPQYICTCTRYNCMCLRYSYTNKTCPGPGTLPYYTCIHPPCLALSLCSSPLLCTACHCLGQTSSSVQLQVIEQLSACLLVKASWTLEQQQQKPA